MNLLNVNQSRYFDFLKFSAAICIVLSHCDFLKEWEVLKNVREILFNVCIPIFFAISSYLFVVRLQDYEAVNGRDASRKCLYATLKRLGILFLIWYILMLPWTYERWWSIATYKETFMALLTSCTFNGYWFIKALFISTIIIYFCNFYKWFRISCWILFGVYYIFTSYNYIFNFISIPFSPYYSFAYHMIPCLWGLLAAKKGSFDFFYISRSSLMLCIAVLFIVTVSFNWFEPIEKKLNAFLILALFEKLNMPERMPYVTMRKASTLLYMLQFAVIFSYDKLIVIFPILNNSILMSLMVLIICIGLSMWVLNLSKKEKYKKLSYAY